MQYDRDHSPERQAYWVERVQRLGIYSLINRGLLPRYADFSPALAAVHPQPIKPRMATSTPREHEVAAGQPEALIKKPRSPSSKEKPDVTKTPHASEWALDGGNDAPRDDEWVSASSAHIHIVNGRVLESSALQSLLTTHPHHVVGNAVSLVQFLEHTALLYAIDLIVLDVPSLARVCTCWLPPWSHSPTRRPSLDMLAPAVANWSHVYALSTRPGRRYMGLDGHWAAIVKIQATWRMARQRTKYLETCVSKTAARVILEFRRKCLTRAKFYERVMKQLESHVATVSALRTSLLATYSTLHPSAAWHVHIHLPSASLPDRVRFLMKDVTPLQTHHAGRLVSALADRARVIYISPVRDDPLVQVAMRYLARSTRFPRAAHRAQVLVPEVLPHAPRRAPLSLSVYASTALVNKVKESLASLGPPASVLAVMVPYLVDAYDVRAASLMGVPMLALGVGRQEHFATRVGYLELVTAVERREAELAAKSAHVGGAAAVRPPLDSPRGVRVSSAWPTTHPHMVGVQDEAQVWVELARLLVAHPKVSRWMLKIRDEAHRRGVAVFHRKRILFNSRATLELHEVVEKIKAVPEAFTFMPPRIVVHAFGHPMQLYTLEKQEAEDRSGNGDGSSRTPSKRRKGPVHLVQSTLSSVAGSVSGSRTSLAPPTAAPKSPTIAARAQSRAHSPPPLSSGPAASDHAASTAATRPTTTTPLRQQTPASQPMDLPANTPLPTPAYPTVSAYLSSFCKSGGIIEALIDHPNGLPSSPSSRTFFGVHLELHPTGELQVHATWESIPLHDFDQCLLVLPARQIPPDVLVGHVLKLAPVLMDRGIVGHVVVEFVAYMDQQPSVDLFCVDIKPYWSDVAAMAGLAKIVMDARYDYPSLSGVTGKPLVRQRGRGDARFLGHGAVGRGEYVTDMGHLRPANLRMATQAKWLDMERLNQVADKVVQEQGVNVGEEVRCAVILSGWVNPWLQEVSHVTMNATLQACDAEMNDTLRRGVLFLGDPHRSALAVDRTVTESLQSLRDALLLLSHRFQASPLTELTCNLHTVCGLLNRMQAVYQEIEGPFNPHLEADLAQHTDHVRMHRTPASAAHTPAESAITSDAYLASVLHANTAFMKTATYTKLYLSPPAQPKEDQEQQSAQARRTAEDMYAAALLAQEIYNLGRKIAEFSKYGASMTKYNHFLHAEIMDTEVKRKTRKRERKRDVKRSLRADREAAMRLAAGGMSVAEAEAEAAKEKEEEEEEEKEKLGGGKEKRDKKSSNGPPAAAPAPAGAGAKREGGGETSAAGVPVVVVESGREHGGRRGGGDESDDSDTDSSDDDDDGPLQRSTGNTRSPVELLAAGASSVSSVLSTTALGPPTHSSQAKLGSNNVLKLMRGMFERVQEKVAASSHHVDGPGS